MSVRRTIKRANRSPLEFKVAGGTVRDRRGKFYVFATVQVGDRSVRVRQSLHIAAERANIEAARIAAEKRLAEARAALGGVARKSFSENAADYLRRAPGEELGATDVAAIQELTVHFGTRLLFDIPGAEFVAYVDDRQRGNSASTRERYLSVVVAFLNVAIAAGQYPNMPEFIRNQKARNPSTRARRAVQKVTHEIISALCQTMHIATMAQIAVEEATGARVRSVLHGCALADLDLAPGRMTLTFRKTKTGKDVPAALPEALRQVLADYLTWRNLQVHAGRVGPGSAEPLFLTPRGLPYKDNHARWGTQNKSAFNGAKRRAKKLLEQHYDAMISAAEAAGRDSEVMELRRRRADDLDVLGKLTQHWFRHMLATALGRQDPRAAMNQGGWADIRSLAGYMMDDPEYQRELVETRGVAGTNLTQRGGGRRC